MPKKKKISKAVQSRKNIKRLYERNFEAALDNKIRWTYETAKKIYNESRKTGISQRDLFSQKLDKSFRQKSYYVAKRFNIDLEESREIVRDRITLNIPYKENPLVSEERERAEFFDLLEPSGDVTAFMNFKEFLTASVETIIFNGETYTKEEFLKAMPNLLAQFEDLLNGLKINVDYGRFLNYFSIDEIKTRSGETKQIIIKQLDRNEILSEANRVQKQHGDWQVFQ